MKKIKATMIAACAALFISSLFIGTALAEIAIIANPASGASELNTKTAKKLFLGKTKSVPGMDSVTLVSQTEASSTTAEFTQKVTKKTLSQYKSYWSRMIFSGKAVPPRELANDAEVKAFVAKHADAIGYVDASAVDDSVKVLLLAP